MLITITKQFLMGLEEDWFLLLPCTFVHCRMMASLHPCWIGTGEVEADPPDKNFQSPVWGSSSTSGGGVNPLPPTNRTLEGREKEMMLGEERQGEVPLALLIPPDVGVLE